MCFFNNTKEKVKYIKLHQHRDDNVYDENNNVIGPRETVEHVLLHCPATQHLRDQFLVFNDSIAKILFTLQGFRFFQEVLKLLPLKLQQTTLNHHASYSNYLEAIATPISELVSSKQQQQQQQEQHNNSSQNEVNADDDSDSLEWNKLRMHLEDLNMKERINLLERSESLQISLSSPTKLTFTTNDSSSFISSHYLVLAENYGINNTNNIVMNQTNGVNSDSSSKQNNDQSKVPEDD